MSNYSLLFPKVLTLQKRRYLQPQLLPCKQFQLTEIVRKTLCIHLRRRHLPIDFHRHRHQPLQGNQQKTVF
jgi:hypothetical protein